MFGECHGHIFMNGVNYKDAVRTHKDHIDRALIREYFAAYRDAGIRFFREGGDYLGVSSYAKEIAGEYGIDYRSPVFAIHKRGHYGRIVGLEYETIPEFAVLVKKAASEGADFIKIMFGGILDFGEVGKVTGSDGLPAPEMKELVHICHEEGFSVMVHVNSKEPIRNALLSGVDSIEHGNYMTKEEIGLLAETGCVWVPTIAPYGNLIGTGLFPDDTLREIVRRQSENVYLALKAGAHVALGSDAGAVGVPHVKGLLDEYDWMRAAAGDLADGLDDVLRASEEQVKETFRRGACSKKGL